MINQCWISNFLVCLFLLTVICSRQISGRQTYEIQYQLASGNTGNLVEIAGRCDFDNIHSDQTTFCGQAKDQLMQLWIQYTTWRGRCCFEGL